MAKVKLNSTTGLGGVIDTTTVKSTLKRVEDNAILIDDIVNKLVDQYCKPLDDYIAFIQSLLNDQKNPPSNLELDDFCLNIPVLLYFTGEGQEALGVREDVAKAVRTELFSEAYNQHSGTIADKTAHAELRTQEEYIVHTAYQRAYKKVKLRMELGNEVLQAVKKVIGRRMTELEVAKVDPQRFGGIKK